MSVCYSNTISNDKCPICLFSMQGNKCIVAHPDTTKPGVLRHHVHQACLATWFNTAKICPECRVPANANSLLSWKERAIKKIKLMARDASLGGGVGAGMVIGALAVPEGQFGVRLSISGVLAILGGTLRVADPDIRITEVARVLVGVALLALASEGVGVGYIGGASAGVALALTVAGSAIGFGNAGRNSVNVAIAGVALGMIFGQIVEAIPSINWDKGTMIEARTLAQGALLGAVLFAGSGLMGRRLQR